MDPSSFLLGVLVVSAKVLGIGAVGFGIAWWRARRRIRELEGERQPAAQPLLDRIDRLENTLDAVAAALERLAAGQSELQRRLPSSVDGARGNVSDLDRSRGSGAESSGDAA
jgi:hypothetical protein